MAKLLRKIRPVKTSYTSVQFLLEDYPKTLFPLRTNRVLAEAAFDSILEFAHKDATASAKTHVAASFLTQKRVFAMKAGWHLRRTFKLDPVAEIFLYDLIFRNRSLFRKSFSDNRESFGYRFSKASR